MTEKRQTQLNRAGDYPKMDCTGTMPESAELFNPCAFPVIPDGKVMLAMDKEGNVFNLGNDVALYVADIDQDDQDS